MRTREVIPLKQSPDFNIRLPGSKSITNRVLLCAALAEGKSRLFGALESDDTAVMMDALQKLGTLNSKLQNGIEIEGRGGEFKKGDFEFDLHNAGTAVRFLTAIMSARKGTTIITGNNRMKERPIGDLVDGLRQIGAEIEYLGEEGFPPIKILNFKLPITNFNLGSSLVIRMKGDKSSQYFSALLMLGPLLPKPLTIEVVGELVSKSYIDTTIAVMNSFGVTVDNNSYKSFVVKPQKYKATDYQIEGDASAASYWTAIADLHGGKVGFENLDVSAQYAVRSTQAMQSIQGDANFPSILSRTKDYGLRTKFQVKCQRSNVKGQMSKVKGQRLIDMNDMPDSAMTLACMAPFADGTTEITGLSTLRIKETDRIAALEKELKRIGVKVKATNNAITVGATTSSHLQGNVIQTYNDHRMAMCFAVIGTMMPGIVIENPGCVDKTYPKFWEDLEKMYLSSKIRLGQKNLVLTGMRGAGKTYLGKKIAEMLGREFVDTDAEIEKAEGMSVSEVVKKRGWDYFRKVEQNICSQYQNASSLVISTGGGVVLNPENMSALKKNGVNVFIFSDPDVLAERIGKSDGRPALKTDDPISELREVWEERRGLYLKYADYVWDNTSGEMIEKCIDNRSIDII